MDRVKFGLVGYGRFGGVHASTISSTPGAELACVCVGQNESVEKVKKQLAVDVYSDYDEFLQKGKIDVVDIVSPNYLHATQAVKALQKGKDVLLEKPVAITMDEARKIIIERDRSSRTVQVGFEARYAPFNKIFKSAVDDGSIGKPTFAKIESWRAPFRPGANSWRYNGAMVGHQLLEEAIHYFDEAAWLFGAPRSVWGYTDSPQTWDKGVFSTAVVVLEYPGLSVMILNCLAGIGEHLSVEINGGGAIIGTVESELSGPSAKGWIKKKNVAGEVTTPQVEIISEADNLKLEVVDFVDRVRKGAKPFVTLEDGALALSIALAAVSAVSTGNRVSLPM
jgi:myo-inositol 2-dehydrogenase/D-chiro-inositol 1-dehydrogenase